jgi:outer membrane protein insertion porin family
MGKRFAGVVVLLLGLRVSCPGEDLEGRPVVAIRFEPAKQPFSAEYLQRILILKQNAPLRMGDIRAAIKRLYATGRYTDITAEGEAAAGGVAIIFHTREQWFVGRVDARGKVKDPPNQGQLANASRFILGQPFSEVELPGAVERVRTLLRENGFYEATVEAQIARDTEHQQVNIVFVVETGKRARYNKPGITGNPVLPAEKVA